MKDTSNFGLRPSNSARPCVLSIAGFDPSGGAGILADIKTFEANQVYGMGAVSAITFQNDAEFENLKWMETEEIIQQVIVLQKRFEFPVVKIGLVKNLETLEKIISVFPVDCKIIWDPIIKATAGFEFHSSFDKEKLKSILKKIFLLTPNTDEINFLARTADAQEGTEMLSQFCNVLLKGGHNITEPGTDYLFHAGKKDKISASLSEVFPKHGSGCILSSAIAANLAKGYGLLYSCTTAKKYTEKVMSGNSTLLAIHHVQ